MTDEDEKEFNDRLADKYLERFDPKRKNAAFANTYLRLQLGDWYDKSIRKNELYLINSVGFKKAIAKARSQLKLKGAPDNRDFMSEPLFNREVDNVIKEVGLTNDWTDYISLYIAYDMPPQEQTFYGNGYLEITGIDEDGQVLVRLKPGLRKEDYVNAWRVLSRYLGPAHKKSKPYTSQEFNNKIYEARQNGLSYGELAEQFFPGMKKDLAVDRIKKAVKRESQRRKKGDKTI